MLDDKAEHAKYLEEVNREHALRAHELNHRSSADARKAAVDSAAIAIRSLILVNGGAVVALLAFVGSIESGNDGAAANLDLLVAPIQWFALGVGLSAIVAALAYIVIMLDNDVVVSVSHVWEHPYVVPHARSRVLLFLRMVFHIFALALALASLVAFFMGVQTVTGAIAKLGI